MSCPSGSYPELISVIIFVLPEGSVLVCCVTWASRMFVRYRRCRFSPHTSHQKTCYIVLSAKDMLFRIPFDVSGFLSPARGHVLPILLFEIEYKFALSYSGSVSTASSTEYGPAVLFALGASYTDSVCRGKCVSSVRSSQDSSP